jgi:hypothetical protein
VEAEAGVTATSLRIEGSRLQAQTANSPFAQWIFPDGTHWADFYREGREYLIRFYRLADFMVSPDGWAVLCWPAPNITEETVQHLYLNQVLPLALSRQGKLVLHAGAVEIGDRALAFAGASGRGKSTLTASFARNGFRFLSDDGLMLTKVGHDWNIAPSHPSIRLWQDSEDALMPESAIKAAPLQFTSKSRFLAGGDNIILCDEARPLHRMYFLGSGDPDEPQFHALNPAEALLHLVRNSFLLDVTERETLAAHFDELCALTEMRIWYRLDYPRRFNDLPRVRQAILEHAALPPSGTGTGR